MATKKKTSTMVEELSIDPSRLDYEWARQAMLHAKYSQAAASARKQAREAKEDFELLKAQLDTNIRSDPTKYLGDVKLTENALANCIRVQDSVQEAQQDMIDAEYHADLMEKMVYSILQKRDALLHLVRLFLAEYYADDGEVDRTNLSELMEKYNETVRKEIEKMTHEVLNRDH